MVTFYGMIVVPMKRKTNIIFVVWAAYAYSGLYIYTVFAGFWPFLA